MDHLAGAPRPGLTRDTVISVALQVLDETGLDGVTTRRLAAALGVKSPALYWHFRSKQELLDQMAEAILLASGMGPPRPGQAWQDWLAQRGHNYRRHLLAHRDGARLIASARLGPAAVSLLDRELAAMRGHGFTPVLALRTIAAISRYVTGFVLQEQAHLQDLHEAEDGQLAAVAQMLHGDTSAALVVAIREGGSPFGEQAFEHGLRALIEGSTTALTRYGSDDEV